MVISLEHNLYLLRTHKLFSLQPKRKLQQKITYFFTALTLFLLALKFYSSCLVSSQTQSCAFCSSLCLFFTVMILGLHCVKETVLFFILFLRKSSEPTEFKIFIDAFL